MPVKGVRHVVTSLRALSKAIDVPMNAAARFALRPTLSQARANARAADFKDSSGQLARSLTVKKNRRRSRKLRAVHQVGPSKGKAIIWKGRKRDPVRYAHLMEFGAAFRGRRGGGGQFPGFKAKPFMTPAYISTRKEVSRRFGQQIGPELEKRARKLKAKQRR